LGHYSPPLYAARQSRAPHGAAPQRRSAKSCREDRLLADSPVGRRKNIEARSSLLRALAAAEALAAEQRFGFVGAAMSAGAGASYGVIDNRSENLQH